jgi:hypothetical protein
VDRLDGIEMLLQRRLERHGLLLGVQFTSILLILF